MTLAVTPAHAGMFDSPEEKDPVEPFSVFGSVYKKYVIDVLDEATGRQIVGRKKGFTAEACVDVCPKKNAKNFNVEDVRTAKIVGGNINDVQTIHGMVIRRNVEGSVRHVENAKVAVVGPAWSHFGATLDPKCLPWDI